MLLKRRSLLIAGVASLIASPPIVRAAMSGASSPDPYLMPELANYPAGWQNYGGRTQQAVATADTVSSIIIAGDSLGANSINSIRTPAQPKNDNINIYNGGVYTTLNPMLSCGTNSANLASSSLMTALADNLITAGTKQRIRGLPIGVGGALLADWASYASGKVAGRFVATKRRLDAMGITCSAIIVLLGTNDTNAATSLASMNASWTAIMSEIFTDAGFTCKVFVPQCSMFGGVTSANVRAAQANIVNGTSIISGGDLDAAVAAGNRWDGTHFSASAASDVAAADTLRSAITPYL